MKKRGGEKFALKRIKTIMQANREIGKIQSQTPQVIAWALEAFIEELTTKSYELSEQNGDPKLTTSHVKAIILKDPKSLGFLKPQLAGVPDLQTRKGKNSANKSTSA